MNIFVYVEHIDGAVTGTSQEAIAAAKRDLGGTVTALAFGSAANDAAAGAFAAGADSAIVCTDASLDSGLVEASGPLVTSLVQSKSPDALIAGASVAGRDLTSWVAFDLDAGLISDVTAMSADGGRITATHPVYAGKLLSEASIPAGVQIISTRSRAFEPLEANAGASGAIESVDAAASGLSTEVQSMAAASAGVSLNDAKVIVSGGRGVGGPEGYDPLKELCSTMGAALGASRAAVDAGWIAYDHQVGQTGKTVSPDLYIACGISGAIQHQAGMNTSKNVVAINKDGEAPIFKLARYGVVGDLFEIVPALNEEMKKRLG